MPGARFEQIDLDAKLRGKYEELFNREVTGGLKKVRHEAGNQISCCCPLHNDSNPSFQFSTETGGWTCFGSCGEGNFTSFVAAIRGISTQDAYKAILQENGLWEEQSESQQQQQAQQRGQKPLTLQEYASMKKLDELFLRMRFQVQEKKNSKGISYLEFPYFGIDGQPSGPIRLRYGKQPGQKNHFLWGGKRKAQDQYGNSISLLGLYGEWMIPEFEQVGWAVLVEGESDTQTLNFLDIPALGVPGAQMFDQKMAESVSGIGKLYIHQENDTAGKQFVDKILGVLKNTDYGGEIYIWACSKVDGMKDPSEILIAKGKDEASHIINNLLANAEEQLLNAPPPVPCLIKGAPLDMRPPIGYNYSVDGIFREDQDSGWRMICSSPILITAILENISDPNVGKMEIAFLMRTHRGLNWKTGIFPRATLFSNKGADDLINFGLPITQKKMQTINDYLLQLMNTNTDVIPIMPSTSHYGWQEDGNFLPAIGNNIRRDMPGSSEAEFAISAHGTLDGWLDYMKPLRNSNWRLRIFLTISFAAPLLEIVNVRNFGIYNWDDTRAGKTAGSSATASVWGDPTKMLIPFNSTNAGLLESAALYCDLPLFIEERQTAKADRFAQAELEGLIYQLCFGRSKQKSTRLGGIANSKTWSTILFMTGEQPLIENGTQNGVATRVIQILGGAFPEENGQTNMEAVKLYDNLSENYGVAGLAYIEQLKKVSQKKIRDAYIHFRDEIIRLVDSENRKYESYLALMALADAMSQHWVYDKATDEELYTQADEEGALQMIREFLERQKTEVAPNSHLVATQAILEYISAYQGSILDKIPEPTEERLPAILRGYRKDNTYYLNSGLLAKHLQEAGIFFNQQKIWWKNKGLIMTTVENGSVRYTPSVRPLPGLMPNRWFVFYADKALQLLDSENAMPEQLRDFTVVNDTELPFD